ncbi:hypothetical protein [Helicobacter suis]|uniref:hypothetical protein n=1 Tax=Helicobacter suis TaxID=104628 RepID=UPI0013D4705B|nr:hypothetical protein [Helicobacter suis]
MVEPHLEEMEERRLRTSNKEREALFAHEQKEKQGLSPASLAVVLAMLFIALILFTPKIYLTNNIYYTSRVIQKLSSQKELLQEEKHRLELELEKQRYKYNIENMP